MWELREDGQSAVSKSQVNTVAGPWQLHLRLDWRPTKTKSTPLNICCVSILWAMIKVPKTVLVGPRPVTENGQSGVRQKEVRAPLWPRRQLPGHWSRIVCTRGPRKEQAGLVSGGLAPSALSSAETQHPFLPWASSLCVPSPQPALAASCLPGHDVKSNLSQGPGDPFNPPLKRPAYCLKNNKATNQQPSCPVGFTDKRGCDDILL